jgi:hypothetical protein
MHPVSPISKEAASPALWPVATAFNVPGRLQQVPPEVAPRPGLRCRDQIAAPSVRRDVFEPLCSSPSASANAASHAVFAVRGSRCLHITCHSVEALVRAFSQLDLGLLGVTFGLHPRPKHAPAPEHQRAVDRAIRNGSIIASRERPLRIRKNLPCLLA